MSTILDIDKELFLALNFDGGVVADSFFWAVTGRLIWIPLYLFIVWLLYRKLGWRDTLIAVLFVVLSVVATDQICNFFKYNLPKLRPTHNPDIASLIHNVNNYRGGLYGTVSAHAAVSTAVALFSAILIKSHTYSWLIALWVLLVSYSRIYVGAHYPLDLIFGLITGVIVALSALWLYRYTIAKIDRRASRDKN